MSAGSSAQHPATKRPGFIKIQNSAKLASSEGYDFIWVDTCCIDKTSSAELSEAINSMFRWYQQAAVCYAFLNDVRDPEQGAPEGLDDETIEEIKNSRWFTRGWTLQELIAPSDLCFYAQGWTFIGSRQGEKPFTDLLSEITGIQRELLEQSQALEHFSIAERMQWASRRKTTRIEDAAYCLMGIFDIDMPLLYGEGPKAFFRLQEAIIKETDDQSIFAWKCPENEPFRYRLSGLFARSPEWFRDSGHLLPLPKKPEVSTTPSNVTNSGLHVQFQLQRLPDPYNEAPGIFATILNCRPYKLDGTPGTKVYQAALKLQCIGGDRYARVHSDMLLDMDVSRLDNHTQPAYEYVYVKQNPPTELPDVRVNDDDLSDGIHCTHSLEPIWPRSGRWDESMKTIRCILSPAGALICAFRYTIDYAGLFSQTTDVAVGVREGLVPSGYWCFQQDVLEDQPNHKDLAPAAQHRNKSHRFRGIVAALVSEEGNSRHNQLTLKLTQLRETFYPVDRYCTLWIPPTVSQSSELSPNGANKKFSIRLQTEYLVLEDHFGLDLNYSHQFPRIRQQGNSATGNDPGSSLSRMLMAVRDKKLDRLIYWYRLRTGHIPVQKLVENLVTGKVDKKLKKELNNYSLFVELQPSWKTEAAGQFDLIDKLTIIHWLAIIGNDAVVAECLRSCEEDDKTGPHSRTKESDCRFVLVNKEDSDRKPSLMEHSTKAEPWLHALHLAAIMGHTHVLSLLIDGYEQKWADIIRSSRSRSPSQLCDSPIHLAAACVRSPVVEQVFGCFEKVAQKIPSMEPSLGSSWANAFRNGIGETPLHRAAAMNNYYGVSALLVRLARPEDIECLDDNSRTPLWHAAAATTTQDVMRLLVQHGADVNAKDRAGISVLEAACYCGTEEAVGFLLDHGAQPMTFTVTPSASRVARYTVLGSCFYATLGRDPGKLRAVLAAGANVKGPWPSDLNPLHIAATNGDLTLVQILCDAGCEIALKTPYNIVRATPRYGESSIKLEVFPYGEERTAAELAKIHGHLNVAKYIETVALKY
ncbi:hypothetical protein GQ53DRAFT_837339 [Thozetella sp. PMI_491]|nr:hypothetical protein GQ53DRAFT_837339 [Thozetella sp. PMI_491]